MFSRRRRSVGCLTAILHHFVNFMLGLFDIAAGEQSIGIFQYAMSEFEAELGLLSAMGRIGADLQLRQGFVRSQRDAAEQEHDCRAL
jgi:hypothetical protein